MYPYFRLLYNIQKSRRKPKLEHPFQESTVSMRVGLSDIDPFLEMNNGRYLTLMDIGRFDLGYRVGLFKLLKKHKWSLMVAGVSTRYRRRLKPFQKFTLHSKMLYFDERWFYFHQQFIAKNGTVHASFLVRTAVISKNGLVPTAEVAKVSHFDKEIIAKFNQPQEWIQAWEQSDIIHKGIMEKEGK